MTAREAPQFPLATFREAATHLRRPFTPEAVRFKVQTVWPKDKEPTGGLVVAYIDARLAVERLNLIVPDRWSDHYEPAPWLGKDLALCHLTVDGITRTDAGQGQGKGVMSDALKRAAVKFGVGVSLYAIPKMRINVDSGQAKAKRGGRDGTTLEMTPRGENDMRGIYRLWLTHHGIQAFGEPLDHGDVDDPAGDPEEQAPPTPEAAALSVNGHVGDPERDLKARVLAGMIREAGWENGKVRDQLLAVGLVGIPEQVTPSVLRRLTAEQSDALRSRLNVDIDNKASA
jgi:hypothetical protein